MTLALFSVGKTCRLIHGNSAEVLRTLAPGSIDAVVTDPPSSIGFMGVEWDGDRGGRDAWVAWLRGIMELALVALKPGGHALVWQLPKRSHWTALAVEDAGFEIRDVHHHIHGQGMPKAGDVGKMIDKHLGIEREVVGVGSSDGYVRRPRRIEPGGREHPAPSIVQTVPSSPEAKTWTGWASQLKPAVEHWILGRKPVAGTLVENVLAHGTGALHVDACRIGTSKSVPGSAPMKARFGERADGSKGMRSMSEDGKNPDVGRWPAHLSLDEVGAAAIDEQSGVSNDGVAVNRNRKPDTMNSWMGTRASQTGLDMGYGGSGGASRFFYCPKPSEAERTASGQVDNDHETVKSIALMSWLVRLICPPGGTVLDPFAGSGTTGLACATEGMSFVGIEQSERHHATASKRLRLAYGDVRP